MTELTGAPTPFTQQIKSASGSDAYWMDLNDLQVAVIVNDYMAELDTGRNGVALLDTSLLQKLRISGPDAGRLLDYVCVRKVSDLPRGRVAYLALVTDEGMIRDDATAFRLQDGSYLVVSGSNLLDHVSRYQGDFDVAIEDVSAAWCTLSVYGPKSYSLLRAAGIEGLESLKAFHFLEAEIENIRFYISRTGFSGGLGYELWIPWSGGETICKHLLESEQGSTARFVGVASIDILRIESGYLLPGHDFPLPGVGDDVESDRYRSPFDVGLDWLVDFDREDFVGKKSLLKEKETGSRYELFAVELQVETELDIETLAGTRIRSVDGDEIGEIFAGGYSLMLGKYVGLCNVRRGTATDATRVIAGDDKWPAVLKRSPLYVSEIRTQTPPPS